MPRFSRLEVLLFLATFFAFAYFNQGGGWNQNSRFAEVRAMAEEGRFAIDDFFVYRRDPAKDDLVRVPVRNTQYEFAGKRYELAWVDGSYNLIPMIPGADGGDIEDAPMIEVCASGDVGYVPATGHFHPNKPPGTSFLALPAYWLIFQVERLLGINPDNWWVLTVNVWLTTVLSVGLMTAAGCVLFFRLAREMADGEELPAVMATLALAFGTTLFPFATLLFDHALTASLFIAALYFLRGCPGAAAASHTARNPNAGGAEKLERDAAGNASAFESTAVKPWHFVAAGVCAGLAVLTNYVAVGAVSALGLYALLARSSITMPRAWNWRGALLFAAGGAPLAVVLGWYHTVNFGSPFALSNDFQNPVFKDPAGSLGMFAMPNPYVGALLLVSPYRGVFWLCPVLILGLAGLVVWLRERRWVAEARLCLAIFAWFFLVNMSFNGYHAGFSAGPRYLVPGMPFLALPLVVAFARWQRTSALMVTLFGAIAVGILGAETLFRFQSGSFGFGILSGWIVVGVGILILVFKPQRTPVFLLALSIVQQLLLTATDGQNPLAVGGHARLPDSHRKDDFFCNLVTEYAAPLFFLGRCDGLLDQLLEARLDGEAEQLKETDDDPAEVQRALATRRAELQESIAHSEQRPFVLAAIHGPVSVNPVAVYEGLLGFGNFDIHSPQARWASCNAGEFLFPESRWSLLPLLLVSGGLSVLAVRAARRGAV